MGGDECGKESDRGGKYMTQQNNSYAVMAQRDRTSSGIDDFPTPPWAVRAMLEHVLERRLQYAFQGKTCREPACGRGYTSKVLAERFASVESSDVLDYGFGSVADYTKAKFPSTDWLITNPPFSLAKEFALKGMGEVRDGLALLSRTAFVESRDRWDKLFSPHPPAIVAQYVERVPMVQGRLSKTATTATSYAWFIWLPRLENTITELMWIPPSRNRLEKEDDWPNWLFKA